MSLFRVLAILALFTSPLASAQEEGGESTGGSDLGIEDIMKDIDLGPEGGSGEVTYEGRLSSTAPSYGTGKPVSITHTGGTIAVRCMDQPGITARLGYTVYGTKKEAMESYGKSIGLSSWGDANGGGVKTRIPTKPSGISRVDIPLTVNLPLEAQITIVGGAGWVQVIDCKGTVKSTNNDGGAYVSGTYRTFNVSAGKGDVKVELTDQSTVAGTNSVNAPGGSAVLRLPMTFAGKFTGKGSKVSVFHTVMGTNTDTLVQGTVGTGTAALTVSARDNVEVTAPK